MKLKDLQSNWNRMGKDDPLWAVSTAPQYKNNQWDPEEFFATGREEIAEAIASTTLVVPDLARSAALDFGAGVGRLTQALAEHFESVTGVDIAPAMIEHARSYNKHGDRVQYLLNEQEDLALLPDSSFDFIYSAITLMHMEPRYSSRYIAEFVRLLKPGGVAMFQIPEPTDRQVLRDRFPRWFVYAVNRVRTIREPMMEVHGVARTEVEQIVGKSGGRIVETQARPAAHGAPSDYAYWVSPVV